MSENIFINTELNTDEEILISRNCNNKIVIILDFENKKDAVDLVIKEKKYFEQTRFCIITENKENESNNYIGIDRDCRWWLNGKHYATLELDMVDEYTTSLDVLLVPNKYSQEKTLIDFSMEIEDWTINQNRIDKFEEWYTLCGEKVYSLYETICVGTFARVSNGWKFYPKMQAYREKEMFSF